LYLPANHLIGGCLGSFVEVLRKAKFTLTVRYGGIFFICEENFVGCILRAVRFLLPVSLPWWKGYFSGPGISKAQAPLLYH
jgi:hypothetical protein